MTPSDQFSHLTNNELGLRLRSLAETITADENAPRSSAYLLFEAAQRLEALLEPPRSRVATEEFFKPLAPRERAVVDLLLAGGSTKVISEKLELTISTVNTYIKRIFGKLGVRSRVELVAKATGRA